MRRKGLVLLDLLVALLLFVLLLCPLVGLLCGGSRQGRSNAKVATAMYVCQDVVERIRALARVDFDDVLSEPGPRALVPGKGLEVSRYCRADADGKNGLVAAFPRLGEELASFRVGVNVSDFEGSSDAKLVEVTTFYRLEAAPRWQRFTLATIVTRRLAP